MVRKTAIVIIDSETAFRRAVRSQIGDFPNVELVGEAEHPPGGHELIARTRPDLVILELPQRPEEALTWAEKWHTEFPGMRVYASSASKNPDLILSALRAGVSEYISRPLETGEFRNAIEKLVREIQSEAMESVTGGEIIAVFSKKGGLGVTTVAVNLAVALARRDQQTCIVDLAFDLGDVASQLDLRPEFMMGDVLDKHGRVDPGRLQSAILRHPSGLFYLGEKEAVGEPETVTPAQVRQMLLHLKETFRFTVLDLPHTFDTHTYEALQMADRILLVATCDLSTIRATRYALRVFRTLGYDERKVNIVLNRVSKRDSITVAQFAETVQYPVSFEVASDYRVVIESINAGEPFTATRPKADVTRGILRLAEQFGSSNGAGPSASGGKRGLFGRGRE